MNFELAVMPLLYLLPARWVRQPLLHAAWRRLWEQFDKHTGRLRYDFLQRMQNSIRDYAKMLDAKVEDTVQGIEMAIRQAMAEHERGEAAVEIAETPLFAQRQTVNQLLTNLLHLSETLAAPTVDE